VNGAVGTAEDRGCLRTDTAMSGSTRSNFEAGLHRMGTFFAEVQLASSARPDRRETVTLLVDSGSMYTWVFATVDLTGRYSGHRSLGLAGGTGSQGSA